MGILSRQPNDWISAVVTSPVGFQFAILAAAIAVVGIPLMYAGLNEQLFDEQQFQRRGRAGVLMVEALVLILVTLTAVAAFFVVGAVMAVALFAAPRRDGAQICDQSWRVGRRGDAGRRSMHAGQFQRIDPDPGIIAACVWA